MVFNHRGSYYSFVQPLASLSSPNGKLSHSKQLFRVLFQLVFIVEPCPVFTVLFRSCIEDRIFNLLVGLLCCLLLYHESISEKLIIFRGTSMRDNYIILA